MTTKEMINVMTAYENGAEIEYRNKSYADSKWERTHNPTWNWAMCAYRIKQQPKQKLWYWEVKNDLGCWELVSVRCSEETLSNQLKGNQYRKLEALGFVEGKR